jgi:hypothetical protein
MSEMLRADLFYTVKAVAAILTGFDRLETRNPVDFDGIIDPGFDSGWREADPDGILHFGKCDIPYYVCPRFHNGRHIPLPLILGERSEFPLQDKVLRWMRKLGFLRRAKEACEDYVQLYELHALDERAQEEEIELTGPDGLLYEFSLASTKRMPWPVANGEFRLASKPEWSWTRQDLEAIGRIFVAVEIVEQA